MTRAVGIDLGTTYTVAATIEAGRPKVIPNAEGQQLTPSVVAFTGDGTPLVGQQAKAQAAANPHRTVFSIKRRMGSGYKVSIDDRDYTPQEVSSLILRKVRADAEAYLGEGIDRAVITVPAYFNDRQRQATREAGVLAGLDVMRIINEPTAAALAYGLEREEIHTILVWDLGGGTFDVSILDLGEGIFEVRAVSGDTWLGGDDFDQRVLGHFLAEYKRVNRGELPGDAQVRQRLRELAEAAKIALSSSPATRVHLPPCPPALGGLEVELTREQLESLTHDLSQRLVAPTRQALADAGLSPEDIDRVLLVGGATRMPAVRRLAKQVLGTEPYRYINPDQVVALGAAIQAGMLLGLVEKAVLLDVLPLSLGVETQGGLTARIIPRNTPLPASGSQLFSTAADYQTSMDIHVLQGERDLAADNVSLGQFQLNGIPSARRGVAKVEVAFEADVDGIVHVSAEDLLTETEVKVQVTSTKFLDPAEMSSLVEEAERSAGHDREQRIGIEVGLGAEHTLAAAEMALEEQAGARGEGWALPVRQASARLREALDGGATEDIKACTQELRRLLAAMPKSPQTPLRGASTPGNTSV